MSKRMIRLRGVEVHNLKQVDLDLPHRQLIVFCGPSGSGKTSLALDTLYAEGQRRYIESFSAYTRQFLERLDKPAAQLIDGIPPAIAVSYKAKSRSNRSTVGTATEAIDYLRLLVAKIGRVFCCSCGREVRRDTPQAVADELANLPEGTRFMIAFPIAVGGPKDTQETLTELREEGFVRAILGRTMMNLSDDARALPVESPGEPILVVVDRLTAGGAAHDRIRDSLETGFARGSGSAIAFVEGRSQNGGQVEQQFSDGRSWSLRRFSAQLRCDGCGIDYPEPEARLLSFNSPLGACPECEGFGNVMDVDMELVVPNPAKSIREGAIAPWTTPAYAHELEELIELAPAYGIPIDVPFRDLAEEHLALIRDGVSAANFGGLRGFFAWLDRHKYKVHLRAFLSRWRSARACPRCQGGRLRPEALAVRLRGKNIAELCWLKVQALIPFFGSLELAKHEEAIGRTMLEQLRSRLGYLEQVGLGYLTLDRTLRTLSRGEARRVALTGALGSSLVNMLYVLDEPSVGLHAQDIDRVLDAVVALRERDNTVVVVEHEESIIRKADQVVEVGPGAGAGGGRIVFQGTANEMAASKQSLTGAYLSGRRGVSLPERRRSPQRGWIRLTGARGNNLKNVTVEFPLGVLCLITGVSGAGKSTLVENTLYPALCRRMQKRAARPLDYDDVLGDGQLDDVILVDQSPIGRSPRSNPVTYIKAFDTIREVFAETIEARTRNFGPSHFSFNVDGGRCPECQGDGYLQIDMQFMADVYMKCSHCGGKRFRREILNVRYRGRNIADVLEMTVRQAFSFFRGHAKVQARLKRLIDVGLDYLRLGQPANTLSGGEAQRLKLAQYISASRRGRTLFLLDEPTTGLHFADVVQLIDCFDALLAVGHSLVVVEHNLQLMAAADYLIDLGPGAADEGGNVVIAGTPEQVARHPDSATGRFLARYFSAITRQPAG